MNKPNEDIKLFFKTSFERRYLSRYTKLFTVGTSEDSGSGPGRGNLDNLKFCAFFKKQENTVLIIQTNFRSYSLNNHYPLTHQCKENME